jgi:hypothetical protein
VTPPWLNAAIPSQMPRRIPPGAPCTLEACRLCTACAHSHHDACRKRVTCPTDGLSRLCVCCGNR